jgi:hypothetical protein
LCLSKDVATILNGDDTLLLNEGWLFEAKAVNASQETFRQGHFVEVSEEGEIRGFFDCFHCGVIYSQAFRLSILDSSGVKIGICFFLSW